MAKILENLETAIVGGKEMFKCGKCGYELGPVTEDYKKYARKCELPTSKYQPSLLAPKTDFYALVEYYCPKCGGMFEVEMRPKTERDFVSIVLKG